MIVARNEYERMFFEDKTLLEMSCTDDEGNRFFVVRIDPYNVTKCDERAGYKYSYTTNPIVDSNQFISVEIVHPEMFTEFSVFTALGRIIIYMKSMLVEHTLICLRGIRWTDIDKPKSFKSEAEGKLDNATIQANPDKYFSYYDY